MKTQYMRNIELALTQNNAKSKNYGDGLAWDNKKAKTMRTRMPRGRVYHRLAAFEFKKLMNDLQSASDELLKAMIPARQIGRE